MYTTEHMVMAFLVGLVLGVASTTIFTRRELTIETVFSILIIAIWLSMHTYGFFFDKDVSWLMDFAGFGAAGNFIGVRLTDVTDKFKHVWTKK